MTRGAKLWLTFAVLVAAAVLVGFVVMYLELSSMAHDLHCFDGCRGD